MHVTTTEHTVYPSTILTLTPEESFKHSRGPLLPAVPISAITILPATATDPVRFQLSGATGNRPGHEKLYTSEFYRLGDVQTTIPAHLQGAVQQQLLRYVRQGPHIPARTQRPDAPALTVLPGGVPSGHRTGPTASRTARRSSGHR